MNYLVLGDVYGSVGFIFTPFFPKDTTITYAVKNLGEDK